MHNYDWMQHFEICIIRTPTSPCRMMRCRYCLQAASVAASQSSKLQQLQQQQSGPANNDIQHISFVQAIYLPMTEYMAICHLRDCSNYHSYRAVAPPPPRECNYAHYNNNSNRIEMNRAAMTVPTNMMQQSNNVSLSSKHNSTNTITDERINMKSGGIRDVGRVSSPYDDDRAYDDSQGSGSIAHPATIVERQVDRVVSSLSPEWKESMAFTRKLAMGGDNHTDCDIPSYQRTTVVKCKDDHDDDYDKPISINRKTEKQGIHPPKTVSPAPLSLPTTTTTTTTTANLGTGKRSFQHITDTIDTNHYHITPKRRNSMSTSTGHDDKDLSCHHTYHMVVQLEKRIIELEQRHQQNNNLQEQIQRIDRQLQHLQQCNQMQQQISHDLLAMTQEMLQRHHHHHRRRRSSLSTTMTTTHDCGNHNNTGTTTTMPAQDVPLPQRPLPPSPCPFNGESNMMTNLGDQGNHKDDDDDDDDDGNNNKNNTDGEQEPVEAFNW